MSNLYDTGKPQRIIVEGEPQIRVVEKLVVFPLCEDCGRQTRTVPCEWCSKNKAVEITKSLSDRKLLG
jgi:hypothetical protein